MAVLGLRLGEALGGQETERDCDPQELVHDPDADGGREDEDFVQLPPEDLGLCIEIAGDPGLVFGHGRSVCFMGVWISWRDGEGSGSEGVW